MLQSIRDRFTGVIAFAVIGAIGVTLVISFGNMDQGGVTGAFAAKVNGEEIAMNNYQRAVQNQLLQQQEAFRGELPEALRTQIQIGVLENLVRNEVVTQYVSDAGYRVSDDRLSDYIRSQPVFQVGGQYSYDSYVAILASQGFSPETYEAQQRKQMEVGELESAILASSFYTPSEFRRYIELLAEQRAAVIAVIDPAELSSAVEATDEDIAIYYEANSAEFMTIESVGLQYIEVRLDDIAAATEVSDQDLRAFYEASMSSYIADEQRQGRHILIVVDGNEDEAAQLALELRQRIADGEDFGALAKEYSDDPVSAEAGGDLGWANRGDNVAALDEALFELSEGEVSDPVRSEFGYHIVRLDAVSAGSLKTFEEVRDELKEELRLQNAANQYYALAELADDLALENPDSLEPVAEETGLEIKTVETFTRSGGEPFGYDQTLVDTVFSAAVLDDGENSPLIELSNDRALILRVAEYRPSELEPIELVSTRAAERVKLQKAVDLARSRGEEALQRINGGESITVVAEDIGFSVVETGLVSRNVDTIDAELMAAVFRTQAASDDNLSYYGLPLARGGYALYRVDEVVPGQPEAIDQQARDERKRTLAAQTGSGSLGALIADLRDRADVAVAAGLFDSPAEE